MSFLEVKGALAKLLATENLHVQHDGAATTACFNTNTRVLTLPILTTESSHVYDMFVGHEVGHALYTPTDWRELVDESVPFDFVNVIEDCRIEKMIQSKFPGLRKDFAHGYTELNDKDFFDIADKDYSELNFIDRINLHFKLGHRALMPFTDEEMVYVNLVDDAKTFDDVCFAAKMIAQHVKAKRDQERQQQEQVVAAPGESKDEQQQEGKPKATDGDPTDNDELQGESAPDKDGADDFTSETQKAMDEALQNLASDACEKVCYIKAPKHELSIYPLEFLREDFTSQYDDPTKYAGSYFCKQKFERFISAIKRDVNFMVQQFEMKKSADAYARQQIHKTGVLNTDVLHNYKLTDDLFLRQTVTPDGKNHGLVMLIDWSGSMSDHIIETVKQLLVLVSFCRKVNIPFDVYTFTAQGYSIYNTPDQDLGEDGEVMLGAAMVTHVLTSNAKRREIDKDMLHLFSQAMKLALPYSGGMYSNQLSMGGTPLNNVLFGMPAVIEKFKKQNNVQKVSFVCLTDGESAPIHYLQEGAVRKHMGITNPYQTTLLRHGHKVYQIDTVHETPSIVSYLTKLMPSVTITNIFLAGPKGALRYHNYLTGQHYEDMIEYKKTGAQTFTTKNGWPLVALVNPRSFNDPADEIEVDAGAGKAKVKSALKKFLKNKTTSKLLLSTLVSQFS